MIKSLKAKFQQFQAAMLKILIGKFVFQKAGLTGKPILFIFTMQDYMLKIPQFFIYLILDLALILIDKAGF